MMVPITEKILLEASHELDLDDDINEECDMYLLVSEFKLLHPRNPLKLVPIEGTLKCASEQGVKIDDVD